MRYQQKRFYGWSPEIAYSVGLMASDGCLQLNGRHLDLTSVDLMQLENFSQALGRNFKISEKRNNSARKAYRIQFSDVAYYDFLTGIGLTPVKSKTLGQLLVPDEYYPDFLRGYFDGDGTVYGFWDKRWRSSLMYYTGFASASPLFLKWIQETNARLINTTSGHLKAAKGAVSLTYAKSDSRKLFAAMYYQSSLIFLDRKYAKFIDLLKADPYANKALFARVVKSVNTLA